MTLSTYWTNSLIVTALFACLCLPASLAAQTYTPPDPDAAALKPVPETRIADVTDNHQTAGAKASRDRNRGAGRLGHAFGARR